MVKKHNDVVFFTFGRFNPPTLGHGKLLEFMANISKGSNYRVYLSQKSGNRYNPLSYNYKIKLLRKMFPNHGRNIYHDRGVTSVLGTANKLYNEGYRNIVMVCGRECEVEAFEKILNAYNNTDGYYHFDTIKIVSTGLNDATPNSISSISSTKMRNSVDSGDYSQFLQYLPRNLTKSFTKDLFKTIRDGMVDTGKFKDKAIEKHKNINNRNSLKGEIDGFQ